MEGVSPLVILIAAIFTNNVALTYFLGMCPFISISKDIGTAFGMGVAVIFVMTLSTAASWPILHGILIPLHVEFLQFLIYIAVIAALVQVVELVIERFSPALYSSMGIFLPLITVNCAILGIVLFMAIRSYTYLEALAYAVGSGLGWMLAILAMAGIRSRLRFANVPMALRGPGITMIIAGVMALGFIGVAGIVNIQ